MTEAAEETCASCGLPDRTFPMMNLPNWRWANCKSSSCPKKAVDSPAAGRTSILPAAPDALSKLWDGQTYTPMILPEIRTCPKCGAKGAAFICSARGCPVNGGAAYD